MTSKSDRLTQFFLFSWWSGENSLRSYSFGISVSSDFWKGRLQSLRQPETKRMRILKTAELEMTAIFIGWNLRRRHFCRSIFELQEVHWKLIYKTWNLCKVHETFQLLRQKVLKSSKSAVFSRNAQKNTFWISANRRGREMYEMNAP